MKYLICVILLSLGISTAQAQEVYNSSGVAIGKEKKQKKVKSFDPSKLVFGGGLGLTFGNYTDIFISPTIGYRFTDNFSAGVGLGYRYQKEKDYYYVGFDYEASIITPSVWARHIIWDNVFVYSEFQENYARIKEYKVDNVTGNIISDYKSISVPCLLIGGGYRWKVTDNSSLFVSVLYDVLQQEYSPYKNTLDVRFGFNVGF